ncbi:unnamed protein product [Onchocerca flexuosa]|uniref:2OG-FeII_Oxy_4 domain-containing protein n=1 Tax=Onchocerca flexuosa TaxID=387005 RepID=A0A183I7N0_9BILA|nr:unnamed protein product [Onchocerca flexuosa]
MDIAEHRSINEFLQFLLIDPFSGEEFMLTIWQWKQGSNIMLYLSFHFESWHELCCNDFVERHHLEARVVFPNDR